MKESQKKCQKCGKEIPVGLELSYICVDCLVKRPPIEGVGRR
jgi:NMD protein affecting ribosome stability and mRNA decay